MIAALLPAAILGAFPGEGVATWYDLKAGVAFLPVLPGHEATIGIAQAYRPENWADGRIDPEAAESWRSLPAFGELDLHARIDSLELRVDLPVRRDFDAWQRDPGGSNLPLGAEELDINVPYQGWARWSSSSGAFRIQGGRFHQNFSWSREHGVVLGSDVIHDGVLASARFGRWTFEVFAASLDPWLVGNNLDRSVDSGSEAWIQSHRTIPNAKGRVYDEPTKSLFVHRLTMQAGNWDVAASEILIVGGKDPEMREALPLVVWHNNFGGGFSKMSLGLQTRWSTTEAGSFHAECVFEEIRSPVGEDTGVDERTVYGVNAGWRKEPATGRGGFTGSIDGTVTSATLGNHTLPLLKGVARRRYRSNNRSQFEPEFIDQWIDDQPLAYHRGPDAADLWTRAGWVGQDSSWGAGLEVDWLNQGDAALWMDGKELERRWGPLSGEITSEWRLLADGWIRLRRSWALRGRTGLVLRAMPGESIETGPAVSAGVQWSR